MTHVNHLRSLKHHLRSLERYVEQLSPEWQKELSDTVNYDSPESMEEELGLCEDCVGRKFLLAAIALKHLQRWRYDA